jgi:quercetin dioxygenase-like cupin family protein
MKRLHVSFVLATILIASAGSAALAMDTPTIEAPASLTWTPVKGKAGLSMARLYGDPDTAGSEYAVRLKFADGAKIGPHSHSNQEEVTVLSGTLLVGFGEKWNDANMQPLAAGTFVVWPAGFAKFVQSKGETVIEVHGVGPSVTKLFNAGAAGGM